MTKLDHAELGQAFRRRAVALAATGHAQRAVLDLQVANRSGSLSEEAYADAMDAVLRSASNKVGCWDGQVATGLVKQEVLRARS